MKITVVIPVFNGRKYIVRCLNSIKDQTIQDYCILIVDDGSTDDSYEIICKWQKDNPQINLQLIYQKNKGIAEARNNGIRFTNTEFISFMDQDDTIASDYLEHYLNAIESTHSDIVCGGYTHKYISGKKITRIVRLKDTPWAKFVVVAPWAHLYRTSFLKEHSIRFLDTKIGEDVYFSLIAYANTDKITIISDIGYTWTNNPESHSNKKQKKVQDIADPLILLNALVQDVPSHGYISDIQLEYYLYRYIVWNLLFSLRQTGKSKIEEQYKMLKNWLEKRCPNYQKNRMISLFGPLGEPKSIRISVWSFNVLEKWHMILPLLKLFASKDS